MSTKELTERVTREFKLTTLALRNKNTVYLLILIIFSFGIYSYNNLPKELFPEIVWPQILVQTTYLGNSPVDIENLVTRPLEKELEDVRGLKEITSISAQDASMIFVEFNTDVDLEDALRRVKDKTDMAETELPNDTQSLIGPTVFDLDFSEFPIININLSGDYSIEELKDYAEYLEDEMEEIPQVSKVEIEGVNEREIKVDVDLIKMEAYDLSFYDISQAIKNENVAMSGGEIKLGKTRRTIRIDGEFDRVDELRNIMMSQMSLTGMRSLPVLPGSTDNLWYPSRSLKKVGKTCWKPPKAYLRSLMKPKPKTCCRMILIFPSRMTSPKW
mgnify:CR=1 FL=1